MAAELGQLSLTQLQNLAQHQAYQSTNNVDDDSWEVRAFAEDRSNAMGTTWPPQSYTCTFCRREFRSAQALGGHMNVHRHDRARLRQSPQMPEPAPVIFPSNEFVANNGMCLFYPIPAHGLSSPSTFMSISPNYVQVVNMPNMADSLVGKVGMERDSSHVKDSISSDDGAIEELNLELRLGW